MLKLIALAVIVFSHPSLAEEKATPAGGLDKAAIDEYVKKYLPMISGCHDQAAKKEKSAITGTLPVKFTIGPDGKVTDARAEGSTLKNVQIEECVVGVIKGITFPAPAGGGVVEVSYPFAFAPAKGTKSKPIKKGK